MDDDIAILWLRRRRELRRRRDKILENRRRLQYLRHISRPFEIPEETFMGIYRLPKQLVSNLINEIEHHLPPATRRSSVSPELKVLCALHFYSQGSYQKSAGSDSNLGLSQSSVSRFIDEVTEALNAPDIVAKWLPFPVTAEERREVIQKNYRASRFPGVIGYVDGTHVFIKAPHVDEHLYVNRRGYHTINVQIICDSDLIIMNCVSRFPGSSHDSYIWGLSEAFNEMRRVWETGEQCWLLGDSGYPHQPWLQTPILNAIDGSPEARYTAMHSKARSTVERCIGVVKNRFRCLLRHRVLDYSPRKAGKIIIACCILHNMCVRGGVPLPAQLEDERDPLPVPNPPVPQDAMREVIQEARRVRERIILRIMN